MFGKKSAFSEGLKTLVGRVLKEKDLYPEAPSGYEEVPESNWPNLSAPPWKVVYLVSAVEGAKAEVRFGLVSEGSRSACFPHMKGFEPAEVELPVKPVRLQFSLQDFGVEVDTYLLPEEVDELRRQLVDALS